MASETSIDMSGRGQRVFSGHEPYYIEGMTKAMNELLRCPNDADALLQVQAESRQGSVIMLDQCKCCGGIWFDKWELFQVAETKVRELTDIDLDHLRCPEGKIDGEPQCPRCRVELRSFHDPHIPPNIQMLICDECEGFWLNHGEAAGYADYRQALQQQRGERLAKQYEKMLQSHSNKDYWQGLEQFGSQLGGHRDMLTGLPLNGTSAQLANIDAAQDLFYAIMGTVARLLFRWL
jgi:Zn-finger nucleic acid-binding protein